VITDPLFYLVAVPAVILLGLGKGGFAGLGMISVPLLTLRVPILQGATIILPLLVTQDVISVWTYRRSWSAWNLKVLIPGALIGMGAGTLFASHVSNAAIEVAGGLIGWAASAVMRTREGLFLNVVFGVVGAALGGWLLSPLVGVSTINQSNFSAAALIVSFLGALILLAIVHFVRRPARW